MITTYKKTVLASNVPARLQNVSVPCARIIIQAKAGNSASIYVGDYTTDASDNRGHELVTPPVGGINYPLVLEGKGGNDLDLYDIWFDGTANDVLNITAYIF